MNLTPRGAASGRPLTFVAIALTLAALGNATLAGCGGGAKNSNTQTTGGTNPGATTSTTPPPTGGTTASASGDQVAEGHKIYLERCVLCHGPLGKGNGPGAAGLNPKPRDHTDAKYMNSRTDDQLLTSIRNGKGQMPAWKTVLTDDQIHAVLKYVRTLAGT